MIAKGLTIPTTFTAIDGTKSAVKSMTNGLQSYVNKAEAISARSERAFRKLTPALGAATKQLLSYASAATVLAGLAFSGRAIMDYETAIASLQAVTGVSDKQLVNFKNEIADLSKVSGKSSIDVAKSFETIGSMMSEYLDDPRALRQIAEAGVTLSKASRMELEPTLMSLTSVMNQFGLKANQAADTIDRLTAGEIVGSLRTEQVAKSLQDFGANAYNTNVSLAESVALVEALAKQRPIENVGIDARNILLVMSSAKALDKKAKHSLRESGVDLDFLMDKTHSLSERLHELSKVQSNAVGMAHVFGERNVTAANVIFQQLDVYDDYAQRVKILSKSQEQAATNSLTLAATVGRLRDKWITIITTADSASYSLDKAKGIIGFVTDHMEGLASITFTVVGALTIWKVGNLALAGSLKLVSLWQGIQSAATGYSTYALEANTIAMRAQTLTLGVMTTATEAWSIMTALATGNMSALNIVMIANPIGAIITGIVILTAAIGGLVYMHRQLREEYEKELALRVTSNYEQEGRTIETLAQRYIKLGMSKEEALKKSIKFERESIALSQLKNKQEIEALQGQLKEKQMFVPGIGMFELPGADSVKDKLLAKRKEGTGLAAQSLGLTNYVIARTQEDQAAKKRTDLSGTQFSIGETADLLGNKKRFISPGIEQAAAESSTTTNNAAVTVTLENNSGNPANLSDGKASRSVMPATSSTMTINKR